MMTTATVATVGRRKAELDPEARAVVRRAVRRLRKAEDAVADARAELAALAAEYGFAAVANAAEDLGGMSRHDIRYIATSSRDDI